MDLHEAISTAVKFTWGGKQQSPLRCVRFLPSADNKLRPRIYANKGQLGVMIEVDQLDLPNCLLDGEALAGVVKATKTLRAEQKDPGAVLLTDGDGAQHEVMCRDINSYPAIPTLPGIGDWYTTPDWWAVEQALHAVSKDKQQPHLQCLHFADGVVEATDRMRVARIFVDLPTRGMVVADTFKAWPKNLDTVDIAVTEDSMAWFRLGDEIRLSVLVKGQTFPNLEQVLAKRYDGPAVALDVEELMAAVKKGVATKAEGIAMTFTREVNAVGLSCGSFSGGLNAIFVRPPAISPLTMRINAKWLLDALKVCQTPRVLLGIGDGLEPLRVESGPYLEGIWPIAGG